MVLAAELPQISISFAPPQEIIAEPVSPFSWPKVVTVDDNDDAFRLTHLTPPPTHLKFSSNLPSPLGRAESQTKGLERERFEALLKASRERNAYSGGKKDGGLRKEIALKAHKNKQVERRALFLSKVLAPPSPTAVSQPVTPPDSPALFHFRFPSPGLVSPLALFESLNEDSPSGPLSYPIDPWVEQVDYRLPHQKLASVARKSTKSTKPLPSLDQISARLGANSIRVASSESNGRTTRLPTFLAQRQPAATSAVKPGERPRLSFGTGRLQLPSRPPKDESTDTLPMPKSPSSPLTPQLQITTLLVPKSSTLSPTELSESNLQALESRERRSKTMLSALRRRVAPSDDGGINSPEPSQPRDSRWKRHSAPAEIALRPRAGFEHPVLSLPGGF